MPLEKNLLRLLNYLFGHRRRRRLGPRHRSCPGLGTSSSPRVIGLHVLRTKHFFSKYLRLVSRLEGAGRGGPLGKLLSPPCHKVAGGWTQGDRTKLCHLKGGGTSFRQLFPGTHSHYKRQQYIMNQKQKRR